MRFGAKERLGVFRLLTSHNAARRSRERITLVDTQVF